MGDTLREQILAANDHTIVPVEMPEWGETVGVRSMSSAQNIAYVKTLIEEKRTDARELLISLTACDPSTGELIFTHEDDVKALGEKDSQVLQRLFDAAQKVNGMGKAAKAAKEEAKKN